MASRYWEGDRVDATNATIAWGIFEAVALGAVLGGEQIGSLFSFFVETNPEGVADLTSVLGLVGAALGVPLSLVPASQWNKAYRWKDRE